MIRDAGEVLVVLRYLHAAGARGFVLCGSREEFGGIVSGAPMGTDIEVYRDRQLPIRGVIDDDLTHRALSEIPDGSEYLILAPEPREYRPYGQQLMGEDHAELQEHLQELRGQYVAVGQLPDFNAPDSESLISRSKGGIDGPR